MARRLEVEWEHNLAEFDRATAELQQLHNTLSIKLSDAERSKLHIACADISSLWREQATLEERKRLIRLMLQRVVVEVHDNTDRVTVRLHWSGGFESCHALVRTVLNFSQLDCYEQLLDRLLELTLQGMSAPKVASILEREGFRSPRSDSPISDMMVRNLLREQARCHQQLTTPTLGEDQWHSADLALQLGIPEKRLKDWVTRGWATAIQRPFGHAWIIYADDQELKRLQQLVCCQTGQGRPSPPEKLRTPAQIPRNHT